MNLIATGIDLIECERVRELWDRHGTRVTERLLTPEEWSYVQSHKDFIPRLAGRFAAKEAILKVLGTGWRGGIAWRDMEILNDQAGCPHVTLTGECARIAESAGLTRVLVSITHTTNYAAATALGVADSKHGQ
jgi:holo-[acyl-carrier protein] synthase